MKKTNNNNKINVELDNANQNENISEHLNINTESMLKIGKAKWPLSLTLPIAAFIISMLVSISVGLAFYKESTELAIETNQRFLEEKNRQTKFVFSAIYKEAFDHITFVSQLPLLDRVSKKLLENTAADISDDINDLKEISENYLKTREIYTAITYIDIASKNELLSVIKQGNKLEVTQTEKLRYYEELPFADQLKNLGLNEALFSPLKFREIKSDEQKNYQVFELVIPSYFQGTQIQSGLVILEVDFQRFMEIVSGIALKESDLFLANEFGEIVYSSDEKDKYGDNESEKLWLTTIFPELINLLSVGEKTQILDAHRRNFDDEMISSIFQSYQNTQFGQAHKFIWLIQPSSNRLVESIIQIENHSILMSLGLALLAFIISLVAARRIARPLSQIIESINGLEHKNRLDNLPIDSKGEGGVLARSFHNMQVQNHLKEQVILAEKHRAELAVHSKSEFFASMSHEIRTPMNGVLGMLGLMMKTDLDKQQKHYATLARSSADSLLAIIDDILDLSKIDAGKIELECIDFNLREQLGIFAESMAYRAQDKGLELVLDVTGIEHSMVKADPGRLCQILSNLVGNAIKFTDKGEISIKAKLTSFDKDEWLFHCEVKDSGMGIPSDKIEGLFGSYSQVDSSTTRKFGGTGLGLAIVKQLSKLMNGNVRLESEYGKGSNFIFEVRLGVSSLSEIVIPEQDISGKRILIVDDNPTNLEVLAGQLEYWGAVVISAHNGFTALETLEKKHNQEKGYFDIAILDMGMPDMDGAELGKRIRQNRNYDKIKMVMMTSMAGSGDINKFKNIGFSAYFPKPATTSDLFHALQVLVDDSGALEQLDGMVTKYNISNMTATHMFSNAHILLVEDNPVNQEVALGILEDMGIEVDVAENGLESLEYLKKPDKNYGLIIMDCQMPLMDGYQATREIRSKKHPIKNCDIPIIAVTANALKGDREKCLQAGMSDYLTKPVNPNELEDKLRLWLPKDQQDHHVKDISKLSVKKKTESISKTSMNKQEDNHSDDSEPVWDKASLFERVRQNEALANKLIQLMLDELPTLLTELQGNINHGDLDTIVATAHRIKGSSGNLSAIRVAKLAASIEMEARQGDIGGVRELTVEFEQQVNILVEQLRKQIE